MAKTLSPPSNESEGTQFIVDLGRIELTDDEVDAVQNQITKVALEFARKHKDAAAKQTSKEPYVKILHVKTTHVRSIRR
jgi:3'-phosphoadenosine 5'-phosphosulfate sulfotransferase